MNPTHVRLYAVFNRCDTSEYDDLKTFGGLLFLVVKYSIGGRIHAVSLVYRLEKFVNRVMYS